MIDTNEPNLTPERIISYNAIEQSSIELYPSQYLRTHRIGETTSLPDSTRVRLAGRIYEIFQSSRCIILGDVTGQIKVFLCDGLSPVFQHLHQGDFVGVEGTIVNAPYPQVRETELVLLSKALKTLPTPEEWKGCDTFTRGVQRYLDLILRPQTKEILVLRAKFIAGLREFLSQQGYIEIETPILVPVADLVEKEQFCTCDRKKNPLYLRICHEDRIKRLLCGGLDKLYELGKSFRKEESDDKHSPEFLQLECVEAYADYTTMMQLTQELIQHCVSQVNCTHSLNFKGDLINLAGSWQRMTVREAIFKFSGIDIGEKDSREPLSNLMSSRGIELPKDYYEWYNLVTILIDQYVESKLIQPTFLIDYPTYSDYYAKRKRENGALIERFELYIAGMEIANGCSFVTDPIDFLGRLKHSIFEYQQRNKPLPAPDKDLIDKDLILAKSYGMPPSAIVGFGIERILMLLTNQPSIQEVMWFPSHAR